MARHIAYMVNKANVNPLRYDIKINYVDGTKAKIGKKVDRSFSEHLLKETLVNLLKDIWRDEASAIKLRVSVSNFSTTKTTLSLLDIEDDKRQKKLDRAILKLRNEFGLDILKSGNEV